MGAVCTTSLSVSGPSVIVSADRRSDDAPPEGQPDMDDHEVQRGLEVDDDAAISGQVNTNDGGECVNKVVSSSPAMDDEARPGEVDTNEGSICQNKVASSSPASDERHAKVKCMKRYRIMVKGAACRGSACCGETT